MSSGINCSTTVKMTSTLEPPFEIYSHGTEIGDKNGHVCSAEDPEIAKQILAALRAASSTTVRIEARPADDSKDWTEIFPAQLEWVSKQGHQVRAFDIPRSQP